MQGPCGCLGGRQLCRLDTTTSATMRSRRRLHTVLTGLGAAADDDGSVPPLPPLEAALAQATGQRKLSIRRMKLL